ncbi:MAG: aminotransferase class IV [Chthoniobacterales bacterium]|nr:aminotransferase class IV [Chthoniobacterales bacterium]
MTLPPHISNTWLWQQGTLQPCLEGVPLSDRGFRYGQHLFETIAVRHGHTLFVEEHLQRFFQAAERFHFPIDPPCHQELRSFLKTALPSDDGLMRLFITAGDGAPTAPIVAPRLFVFWESINFPTLEKVEQGVALVSLNHPTGNSYWGVKNGNYWEHVCALKDAHRAGAEEGLIFDANGLLISASMANVLVWFQNDAQPELVTPPLSSGARDGVIRHWVQKKYPYLIERDIHRDDLQSAVAIAITNSRLGVLPVTMLDERRLPFFSLALELAQEYLK